MTISLIVLVPVLLVALVALLGFTGCEFEPGVAPIVSDPYSTVVAATADLVAWGPRADAALPTAADAVPPGSHPGTYGTQPDPVGTPGLSARSAGTLTLAQGTLISNDATRGSVYVDGAYVQVPFAAELSTAQFTVEAWVRTDWAETDEKAYRVVWFCRESTAVHGVQLHANPDNYWEVYLGDNATGTLLTAPDPKIALGTTDYLVVTYDGTKLILYVNGSNRVEVPVPYFPNTFDPLSIGGAFVDPASPLFPFKGRIAEVAYYSRALTQGEILAHIKATVA